MLLTKMEIPIREYCIKDTILERNPEFRKHIEKSEFGRKYAFGKKLQCQNF